MKRLRSLLTWSYEFCFFSEQKSRKIDGVMFCGWPDKYFNPITALQTLPNVKFLSIEYGVMKEILHRFPEMFYLQVGFLMVKKTETELNLLLPYMSNRVLTYHGPVYLMLNQKPLNVFTTCVY